MKIFVFSGPRLWECGGGGALRPALVLCGPLGDSEGQHSTSGAEGGP